MAGPRSTVKIDSKVVRRRQPSRAAKKRAVRSEAAQIRSANSAVYLARTPSSEPAPVLHGESEEGAAVRTSSEGGAELSRYEDPAQLTTDTGFKAGSRPPCEQSAAISYERVEDGDEHYTRDRTPAGLDAAENQREYAFFEEEEANDYTDGPARMIISTDRLKPCVSLLMTMDLSEKVQTAVRLQRHFERFQRSTEQRLRVAFDLEMDIRNEIRRHKDQLSDLDKSSSADAVKKQALQEELSILEQMLKRSEHDQHCLKINLADRAQSLQKRQTAVSRLLEHAFVYANLLEDREEVPDSPIEQLDLQTEYEAWRRSFKDRGADSAVTPLDMPARHRTPTITDEQRTEWKLVNAFNATHEPMVQAQGAFDAREQARDAAWQAHRQAVARGDPSKYLSSEDFDCQWLKYFRELTHELVAADAAYDAAKAQLVAAGICVGENHEPSVSIRVRDYGLDDDIKLSWVGPKAQPKVSRWLDAIEDPDSPVFDDCKTDIGAMGPWESFSSYAQSEQRKRIDAYRATCEAAEPFDEPAPADEELLDPSNPPESSGGPRRRSFHRSW